MNRDAIKINIIESYPLTTSEIFHNGQCFYTTNITGIKVNFTYKTMKAEIILMNEWFEEENPSIEEIKDKIIEVLG